MKKRTALLIVATLMAAGTSIARPGEDQRGSRGGRQDGEESRRESREGREDGERSRGGRGGRGGGFLDRLLQNDKFIEKLELTDEQVATLKAESKQIKIETIDLKAAMEKAAIEQAELMSAEEIDEKALNAAIDKTGAIRTSMAKLRVKEIMVLKSVLTEEQSEKLKQHQKQRRKQMQNRKNKRNNRKKGSNDKDSDQRGENDERPPALGE